MPRDKDKISDALADDSFIEELMLLADVRHLWHLWDDADDARLAEEERSRGASIVGVSKCGPSSLL